MTAVATKVRKPRVKKLPTVVDMQPMLYGCDLPEGAIVKMVKPVDDLVNECGVGHIPMQPVVVERTREAMCGKSLWVHPNGIAFDAYDAKDPLNNRPGGSVECHGHRCWSAYFMHTTNADLETQGWAHVSCGRIMIRRKMMTRRQQDVLEIWAMANGYRGEGFFDNAIDNIDRLYDEDGNRQY